MPTTESFHDFFVASAGVAGALIGLLFVAISVAPERVLAPDAAHTHRIRAAAALTAFSNALIIALFSLIPGMSIGWTTVVVALVGLLFVAGALTEGVTAYRQELSQLREVTFLVGLVAVFVIELISGIGLIRHPHDLDMVKTVAILVAVCFLIGIARAWELIGGPSMGLTDQLGRSIRHRRAPQPPE